MALEALDVSFRYNNGPWILRNVSFTVGKGERVCLVGPSGYGKSTLAKIIAGYLTPTEGTLLWQGAPLPRREYCPVQLIYQHPEKAINPRWKLKKSLHEVWTPEPALLEAAGIREEWLDRWPNELSGGELQRFCILRALSPRTRLLVADEITTMLDVITQAQVWRLLLRVLEERAMGLIAVTHNQALAKRIATRIIDLPALNRTGA